MAYTSFNIRAVPEVLGWYGRDYPAAFSLVLVCSRGLRWDGGDYATRAEAVEAGTRRVPA